MSANGGRLFSDVVDSSLFLSSAPRVDVYCPPLKRTRVSAPFIPQPQGWEKWENQSRKKVCSIDALTDECLFEILRRLGGKHERSIAACVSKRWLMLVSSIPTSTQARAEVAGDGEMGVKATLLLFSLSFLLGFVTADSDNDGSLGASSAAATSSPAASCFTKLSVSPGQLIPFSTSSLSCYMAWSSQDFVALAGLLWLALPPLCLKSCRNEKHCAMCLRISWKGGRPWGVLAKMAYSSGLQDNLISYMEKKAAGSPESVDAGSWTSSGYAGDATDCKTAWANDFTRPVVEAVHGDPPARTEAATDLPTRPGLAVAAAVP